jgi:hypothetical protein
MEQAGSPLFSSSLFPSPHLNPRRGRRQGASTPTHALKAYHAGESRSSAAQNARRVCTKRTRRLFECTDTPCSRRSASHSRSPLTRYPFNRRQRRWIAYRRRYSDPSIAERKTVILSFGIRLRPSRPGVTDRDPCRRTPLGSHPLPITR